MKKIDVVFVVAIVALSGCAGLTAHSGEHFEMAGTPDGIRAFGDTLVGAMKTAKEKDSARNQYFAARESYEREVTTRDSTPGFFQKLFVSEKQGS